MSVFGPNQKEELIIGDALATETSVATFIGAAADKEVAVLGRGGGASAPNQPFYVLQKTNGSAVKGLNYEFSNGIVPANVTRVTAKGYAAAVEKSVRVNGFTGTPIPNATYQVSIRLYNDGGTLSVENFRHIHGTWVTDSDITVANTNTNIIAGLVASLNRAQSKEGDKFTIVANADSIDITAIATSGNPIQDIAKQIEFDVEVSVKSNGTDVNTGLPTIHSFLTSVITTVSNPGVGTGKYLSNLETFTRGYNYEAYRGASYPANFNQPALYSAYDGTYNVIHIEYFSKQSVVGVEEQPAVLTIAINASGGVVATNAILGQLRTVITNGTVPADLA